MTRDHNNETPSSFPINIETLKGETETETETLKGETETESLKGETLKGETLKEETLKRETLKRETLKTEPLKKSTLKTQPLKGETSKRQTSKRQTLKRETESESNHVGSSGKGCRLQDQLARESDVTVSTNVTSYTEYRGFFMYVLCTLALAMFVVWILAPHSVLNHVGISYYPDKYWAQAIPAYSLMLMLYAYVSLSLYNIEIRTFDLTDLRTITDEYAVYPDRPVDYVWKAPSGVWDLPIGLVNEVLYT